MLTSDRMPRRHTRREDESTMRTLRPGVGARPHGAMSRRQRIDCPHERRPGMAVCLHCLHEARVAARDRRNRAIMRFTAWTLSLTVVAVVGTAAANAVTRQPEAPPPRRVASAPARRP